MEQEKVLIRTLYKPINIGLNKKRQRKNPSGSLSKR